MRHTKHFFIVPVFVFIFSCASTPTVVVEPFDTNKTYMSSFDDSWKKLVRFFSTNQIGIGTLEKDSGIITVNNERLSSQLVNSYCANNPTPFLYSQTGGTARGSVTLVEDDGFTTANVNITFSVNAQYCYQGCQYVSNICQSNGTFEKALLSSLE
tara:strand:+ start:161 stop:625 length:465 start_codon:yes stop_codon:yes gene_type:complete